MFLQKNNTLFYFTILFAIYPFFLDLFPTGKNILYKVTGKSRLFLFAGAVNPDRRNKYFSITAGKDGW